MNRAIFLTGAAAVALALVFHALFPRYEWRDARGYPVVRIDRWTGRQVVGSYAGGEWVQYKPTPASAATKDPIQELRELAGDPK